MANMRLVKLKNSPSKGVFVFEYMQEQIERNYSRIKADVLQIIEDEMQRIKTDPDLQHLIPKEDSDRKEE